MTSSLAKILSANLADLLFQLEVADAAQVNGDYAVTLMEIVGASLQELEGADLREFVAIIHEIADAEADEARRRYLEDFPKNFGLLDGSS